MKTEDSLSIYDNLIGKYQAQLQIEISLGHFKRAQQLLDTIINIIQIYLSC